MPVNMFVLHEIALISSLVVASFKCVRNALNPALWYSVLSFLFLSAITLAILYAIQYLGGGLGYLVNQIIHTINSIRHFFVSSCHDWDVEVIDSLSALVDGSCNSFQHPSTLARYCVNKFYSSTMCHAIAWYDSITLTRVFISKPLKAVFTDRGMLRLHSCSMRKATDMCAWVVGTESVLKFMMKKGLWILVCLYIFSPFISVVLHEMRVALHGLIHRVCAKLHKIMPRLSSRFHVNQLLWRAKRKHGPSRK